MSYCTACGTKEKLKRDGMFDKKTGKPTYELVCPNIKCFFGCTSNGGHVFGFFDIECKRCGL